MSKGYSSIIFTFPYLFITLSSEASAKLTSYLRTEKTHRMVYPRHIKRGPSYSSSSLSTVLHTPAERQPPHGSFSTFQSKCQGQAFVGRHADTFVRKLVCAFVHTCTSDSLIWAFVRKHIEKHLANVLVISYTSFCEISAMERNEKQLKKMFHPVAMIFIKRRGNGSHNDSTAVLNC